MYILRQLLSVFSLELSIYPNILRDACLIKPRALIFTILYLWEYYLFESTLLNCKKHRQTIILRKIFLKIFRFFFFCHTCPFVSNNVLNILYHPIVKTALYTFVFMSESIIFNSEQWADCSPVLLTLFFIIIITIFFCRANGNFLYACFMHCTPRCRINFRGTRIAKSTKPN